MKDVTELSVLVCDHGLFFPWADMLSRTFRKTYYASPEECSFPTIGACTIGDGFENVERAGDPVNAIPRLINEVDLFIFPDIGYADAQTYLESIGKPVWGSRHGDNLEVYRDYFMDAIQRVELPVAPHERVVGLDDLTKFLKDREHQYIKVSKFRGTFETFHWVNWDASYLELAKWTTKFGPFGSKIKFMVFDPIDADVEDGYDGYCVDGQYPEKSIYGFENKDKGYLCEIRDYKKLPQQIRQVSEAFSPMFKKLHYRNNFSTEIRITDDSFFFIDPTCRLGSPPSQVMAELITNWPEIIWKGAHGELVQMEHEHKYGCQTTLNLKTDAGHWGIAEFPEEIRQFVKCGNCCEVDGKLCFPPTEDRDSMIGWIVATGDTMEEAIDTLKDRIGELPDGVSSDTTALVELIQKMKDSEGIGIELPDPAKVI
jgi:hypothetical protein